MDDTRTTVADLKKITREFVQERDWLKYHSPKNMAMAIAVEAAELMEHFLWVDAPLSAQALENNRAAVQHEIADIAAAIFMFCDENNIDLARAIEEKMAYNRSKYPAETVKEYDPFQLKKFKDSYKKK